MYITLFPLKLVLIFWAYTASMGLQFYSFYLCIHCDFTVYICSVDSILQEKKRKIQGKCKSY